MAQRRMIAKSISTSNKVNRVSDKAALLFTWLIPHCDDYGRMDAGIDTVRAIVVPMRKWKPSDVEKGINELNEVGLIDLYSVDGEVYLEISKFSDFQTFKNDRERISLYPEKMAENIVNPLESKDVHSDSYKLSKVKLSKVNTCAFPFEDFWRIYPNKVNKKKASDRWDRMSDESRKRAMDDVPKRINGQQWKIEGGKYIPHPTTYLNGERWNDEIRVEKKQGALIF